MERSRRDLLLETLKQLEEEELQTFKDKLSEIERKEGYGRIPLARLTHVDPPALADLLLSSYGEDYGMEVAAGALRAVSQGDLAERLVVPRRAAACATSRNSWWRNLVCCCPSATDEAPCSRLRNSQCGLCNCCLSAESAACATSRNSWWRNLVCCCPSATDEAPCSCLRNNRCGLCNCCLSAESESSGVYESLQSGVYESLQTGVYDDEEPLEGLLPFKYYIYHSPVPETPAEITSEKVQPLSTAPTAEGATGGVEVNIREDSTAGQERKDKCKLCPTEEDPPQEMNPEIVQGPDGNQETYRVHLPGAGSFHCSETELGFEVSAAVTVQYRYDSWDRHLREWSTSEWLVIGPLFNIQAEPAMAVAAVHFPHFLCLAGGQADISQMRIAHFTDVGMTLEEPTGVRPFHAVLENPSFSLYGVIFICSSCLPIPVHSLVLIYQALRLADTTLHLYLIPSDRSLQKAIGKHEKKRQSVSVDKSPQTNEPLYFGTDYTVCCSPEAEITPKKLTFSYTSWENRQPFIEVYIEEMKRRVQLSVTESSSDDPRWEATLRPGDVKREKPAAEQHTEDRFVDQYREQLIQRVTAVDCILDKLYGSVLDEEQYQRVKSGSTNPDKMRKLYELVPSWNKACKNQFYQVLKTTHQHLVDELEGK